MIVLTSFMGVGLLLIALLDNVIDSGIHVQWYNIFNLRLGSVLK